MKIPGYNIQFGNTSQDQVCLWLKEISLANDKSYFDTNISSHHHFYDTKTNELIDIDSSKIELKNIPNPPKGKSIKEIDVVINVENDSQ